MHPIPDTMTVEQLRLAVPIPEVLVAPADVLAVVATLALSYGRGVVTLPEPLPVSGLVVCVPEMRCSPLPSGWAGVWARSERPPAGAWIPLPPAAVADPQALEQALLAAETWRRERWAFAQRDFASTEVLQMAKEIGIALSAERDPQRLLELILTRARHLVAADAGSLYLVRQGEQPQPELYFALAQNDSVEADLKARVIPLNPASVAGAVALSGEVIVVEDVYDLPADCPLHHDRRFDERFHYRTRSIVGLPLATHTHEILGVLQLINRKPQAEVPLADPMTAAEVLPFSPSDVEMLRALASQAAVSLENSHLYEDIHKLLEGFVQAAVTAIEQRDPTTSGHSARVAQGTLALADCVERTAHGPWASARFSAEERRELRYAALLHDFGKVGVREHVLTKSLKLFESELVAVQERFRLARASHRAERLGLWLQEALRDPHSLRSCLPQLEAQLNDELADFDTMLQVVLRATQPEACTEEDYATLMAIHQRGFRDSAGTHATLLTAREFAGLSLRRGTLSPEERRDIEQHVAHSFDFLRAIPWTKDLARVPLLAGSHHEKLDGSGYPHGLQGDAIPLGTRMMTIADIFDALVARDRPYKKAMPVERALDILQDEARAGKLDTALVAIWIEARTWQAIDIP